MKVGTNVLNLHPLTISGIGHSSQKSIFLQENWGDVTSKQAFESLHYYSVSGYFNVPDVVALMFPPFHLLIDP